MDPRKHAPPAIIRALSAAGIAGLLVILFGEMAVPNIHAPQLGTSGLPTWSSRRWAAPRATCSWSTR